MIDYGRVKSAVAPEPIKITSEKVFVSSNITSRIEIDAGEETLVYEYNFVEYTKDEYIRKLTQDNTDEISMLTECVLEISEIVYQ